MARKTNAALSGSPASTPGPVPVPVLEIKSYRSCRADEGDAYSCKLYVDGVYAADVQYGGTGGPVEFYSAGAPFRRGPIGWWSGPAYDRVQAWIKTLPQIDLGDGRTMDTDLEIVVGDVINVMLEKRDCAKWTCFRRPGETNSYQIVKEPFNADVRAWVVAEHGPGVEFLNETVAGQVAAPLDQTQRDRDRICKLCKTTTIFRLGPTEGWRQLKAKFTVTSRAQIVSRYGAGVEFANETVAGQVAR